MFIRVVAVLLIVAVLAVGGYYYFHAQSLTDQANEAFAQNTKNQTTLTNLSNQNQGMSSDIAQIQKEITQAKNDINAETSVVPPRVSPNSLVQELLNQGNENYVTIIPLSIGDWTSAKVGSSSYYRLDATVRVSGELGQVVNYIKALQNSAYSSLSIQSINMQQSSETPGNMIANLSLILYANAQ
jgi:Tfp pilus assembly protein PilO